MSNDIIKVVLSAVQYFEIFSFVTDSLVKFFHFGILKSLRLSVSRGEEKLS